MSGPARMLKPFNILAASLLLSTTALADSYFTEFLGTSEGDFSVNRIEISWSTSVASGDTVAASDLSDLSFSAYDDEDALIFTDNVIVSNATQSIGGVARELEGIVFDAVSGASVGDFDNDMPVVQENASGTTYNIYRSPDQSIVIDSYIDGVLVVTATFTALSQTTSAIPEPSACAGIAGMFGLGLAYLRRRRAALRAQS